MQNGSQRHNDKGRAKTSLKKYTSHFICNVCVWEGVGDRTELQYFWLLLLWPSALCLSRSPGLPNRRPRGPLSAGWWLSLLHLISNFSGPQLNRGPRAPSAWCGFPYQISSITPTVTVTVWLFVLTELYNSSTATHSPTRSLEWHGWSSSSGNNCHAVHRSLSSGASVYECTRGMLACPILLANFRPRELLS